MLGLDEGAGLSSPEQAYHRALIDDLRVPVAQWRKPPRGTLVVRLKLNKKGG